MYIEVIGDTRDGGNIWATLCEGEWSGKPHLDPEQATLFHFPVPESVQQVFEFLREEYRDAFESFFVQLFLAGLGEKVEHTDFEAIGRLQEMWQLDLERARQERWDKDHMLGKEIWQGFEPPE